MKLLPHKKLILTTNYSHEEVINILNQNTCKQLSLIRNKKSLFTGSIGRDGFLIRGILDFGHSTNPIIEGKIIPFTNETHLLLIFRLHKYSSISLAVGLIFIGCLSVYVFTDNENTGSSAFFLPGIFMVLILLTITGFHSDCKSTEQTLKKILNAQRLHK